MLSVSVVMSDARQKQCSSLIEARLADEHNIYVIMKTRKCAVLVMFAMACWQPRNP